MRALLFDLDGVLYQGERAVPGAADAVRWFQARAIPHLFVTNTTSRPRASLAAKLAGFGIDVATDALLTPPVAAREWLRANVAGPVALFVPEATRAEFADLPLLSDGAERGAAAVVLGDLGQDWTFATLNRAFRLLIAESRPPLVALGMTRYWQTPNGLQLDVAPFVVALEHAAGCKVHVLGKPSAEFFAAATGKLGVVAADTCMIGDDIRGDVDAAQQAGMHGILVRTGKFRPSDLELGIRPFATLDSIAALPGWWESRHGDEAR